MEADEGDERTPTERHRDLDRFLTFVDAIVAIAITLLVLPLVELASDLNSGGSVAHLLQVHQAEVWAFLLSFVIIARLWFAQHMAVQDVLLYDNRVGQLLIMWTLTIVFLPFPTALVAKEAHEPVTKILYLGTMALSSLLLGLTDRAVARRPRISEAGKVPNPFGFYWTTATVLLSLVLMLLFPVLSYFPLLLLIIDDHVRRTLLARFGGRRAGVAADPDMGE